MKQVLRTVLPIALLTVAPGCLEGGVRIAANSLDALGQPETPSALGDVIADPGPPPQPDVVVDVTPPPPDVEPPEPELPGVPDVAPPPDIPPKPQQCQDGEERCGVDGVTIQVCEDGVWYNAGACVDGWVCENAECFAPPCVPDCSDVECGGDGCGGICGICPDEQLCTDQGFCEAPAQVYRAVIIEDLWDGQCSPFGSSGADIRGARLRNSANQNMGFMANAAADFEGSDCQNNFTDIDGCLGPPGQSYVSLSGGFVVGSFPGEPAIQEGFRVRIFELDEQVGGQGDPYQVWLATDLECPFSDEPDSCRVFLGEGFGTATFVVPDL